jgi:hypothetical protein
MCPHDSKLDCWFTILATNLYFQQETIRGRLKSCWSWQSNTGGNILHPRHYIQPGPLDVCLQLLGSFLSTWTDSERSPIRHPQLSAKHSQHPSLPVQHSNTCSLVDILDKKREQGWRHRRFRFVIYTGSVLHRANLGHLQAGKNCWVLEWPHGKQSRAGDEYCGLLVSHYCGPPSVFFCLSWPESIWNQAHL